jgi:hypothetical protein
MAKTLGRDGMIGSVVLEGLGYEFRSLTNAEDALVKWTSSAGVTQAKLTGAGKLKVYNAPGADEDAAPAGYVADYYLPLAGGTLSGPLNLGGWPITNVASATADNEVMTRSASDGRYLKPADAASTYLTSVNAVATYLSKADATANYAPKTGSTEYATKTTVDATYLKQSTAATTYAPISGSSAYAPVSGSSNYAPASGSTSYAPKASPSFTGTVTSAGGIDTAGIKADYLSVTPSLPYTSFTSGYGFDAAGSVFATIQCTPTTMYFAAPNSSSAAVYFIKNASYVGTPYGVPVWAASFNTISEKRLKDVISALTGALEKVADLTPLFYSLKADPDKVRQVGLLVEDVEPVLPEVVTQGDDSKGLDYSRLSVLALAAIKELLARVEALEAKA